MNSTLILCPFGSSTFQFHKGTIWTIGQNLFLTLHNDFNSIKVQFEQPLQVVMFLVSLHFNSIKVQFELNALTSSSKCNPYFNSIKVQFEQENLMLRVATMCYFNSIKVQFERLNPYLMLDGGSAFQFHKGTIWTLTCSICVLVICPISIP